MNKGLIRDVLVDISADDDLSEVLDFGAPAHILWIYIPTIDSSTVDIQASVDNVESPASTTYETVMANITGAAGTGDELVLLRENEVAGFRHIKIALGTAQTTGDVTFSVGAVLL